MSDTNLETAIYDLLAPAAANRQTVITRDEAVRAGVPPRWADDIARDSTRMVGTDEARKLARRYATTIAEEYDRLNTTDPAALAQHVPRW